MNIYLIFQGIKNIDLFDLEISQEEGFFAKARLVIKAGIPLPPCGSIGVIQGDEIYFKGALVGEAIKIEESFSEIELIACPSDVAEKLQKLQKSSRVPPYWDALWVKEPEKYEEIQDAYTSSFYCDRRTNDLMRSDWFEGRQTLPLQENFFQDSLRLRLIKNPLTSCTIKVHAHWVQKEEGVLDLSTPLRLAFPYSKVNTYTKEALLQRWPLSGQHLRRSGIWILKSELKEMSPTSAVYPSYSPSLSLAGEKGETKAYRVKRHWFKPTLWVSWQYHQKRKETLVVTLYHAFQPLYPGEGERKLVEFTLQNINPHPKAYLWRPDSFYKEGTKVAYQNAIYRCQETHTTGLFFEEEKWRFQNVFHTDLGHPARASFFLTDRGYQAAEHAMERAKAILAKSLKLDQELEMGEHKDRESARLRDMALVQAGRSNLRADIMVISAALGLVSCLITITLYRTSLPGEVVGIISTIAGIFGSCLKDAYAFEFGSSRGSKLKDGKLSALFLAKGGS